MHGPTSLVGWLCLATILFSSAFALNDTYRNDGLTAKEAPGYHTAIYKAATAQKSSVNPGQLLALEIYQTIEAPLRTKPLMLPACLKANHVSAAMAAAINSAFSGQLTAATSVDTTYIQNMQICQYTSLISIQGPEAIRTALVAAANSGSLCDILPSYCGDLNLQRPGGGSFKALSSTTRSNNTAAAAGNSSSGIGGSNSTSSSGIGGSNSTSSSGIGGSNSSSSSSSSGGGNSEHDSIDDRTAMLGLQRKFLRRPRIKATDIYYLTGSSGNSSPELPPVINFNCNKFKYTQLLDHFENGIPEWLQEDHNGEGTDPYGETSAGTMGAGTVQDGNGDQTRSVPKRASLIDRLKRGSSSPELQQPEEASNMKGQKTFQQVYWVCDDAWPTDPEEQKQKGNVIVFLGNEGALDIPKQPIVFENARRLNALVILIEHRYYGQSLPFPEPQNSPLPTELYKWLTMSQVIADSVSVVESVRKGLKVPTETPAVVIGGSYGGMLAAYHRVVRPDVFASAVAASPPISFIIDTNMWRRTSTRYWKFIEDAASNFGGKMCSHVIREGLAQLLELAKSPEGRDGIAEAFHLCSPASEAIPSEEAAQHFTNWVMGMWQVAQGNNQPPVMDEVELACQVLLNSTRRGRSALDGLSAVLSFLYGISSNPGDCLGYKYDPNTVFVAPEKGYDGAYFYQCCTEGTPIGNWLPAKPSDETLNPEYVAASPEAIKQNCRYSFGPSLPEMTPPFFAANIYGLLCKVGGVVFTNGNMDGWAGGSPGISPKLGDTGDEDRTSAGYAMGDEPYDGEQSDMDLDWDDLASVIYHNGSHCTDTHTWNWKNPEEQVRFKEQRAEAMDYAVKFAERSRQALLHPEPEDGEHDHDDEEGDGHERPDFGDSEREEEHKPHGEDEQEQPYKYNKDEEDHQYEDVHEESPSSGSEEEHHQYEEDDHSSHDDNEQNPYKSNDVEDLDEELGSLLQETDDNHYRGIGQVEVHLSFGKKDEDVDEEDETLRGILEGHEFVHTLHEYEDADEKGPQSDDGWLLNFLREDFASYADAEDNEEPLADGEGEGQQDEEVEGSSQQH